MGKHLTPTQKRILDRADKDGVVNVRTVRVQKHGAEAGHAMNQYEVAQLQELEDLGRVAIIREYQWVSELETIKILGTTYVAKVAP